ncbi:MAG: acyl-CoA/acyl-ACP dehydrogenase [Mycobacterium sp.]|nr:acyl-CoA/acyl-ACP dehydrogenase [Mycobacterium sp.]
MPSSLTGRARALADTVLFPAALEVDRTGAVPEEHWRLLADAGLYGIALPAELGGPGLDLGELIAILETVAGGCLSTAFTWVQHHGMLASLAASANTALREQFLSRAAAGEIRGGVAYAGAVPVPPRMRARRTDGGWLLSGHAPFVSGWGVIDVIVFSAGDVDSGDVVAGLVEAEMQSGITEVVRQELAVADATSTVSLVVEELFIPDDRIVSRVSRADFMANQNFGSRLNATLPIGVALRCAMLLDGAGQPDAADAVRRSVERIRGALDAGLADAAVLLAARADGAELAVRAAAALVAAAGGPGIRRDSTAQLLARQAAFTLVAASRPELKKLLVGRLAGA